MLAHPLSCEFLLLFMLRPGMAQYEPLLPSKLLSCVIFAGIDGLSLTQVSNLHYFMRVMGE